MSMFLCFKCTPLAANLSTNQLLISSIYFSSVTGLIGSQYLADILSVYVPSRQLRFSSDTHLFQIPSVKASYLVNVLLPIKILQSGTNSRTASGMRLPQPLSKLLHKLNSAVNKMCHNIFRSKSQDSIGTLS